MKISCSRKLTWYFIGVYVIKTSITSSSSSSSGISFEWLLRCFPFSFLLDDFSDLKKKQLFVLLFQAGRDVPLDPDVSASSIEHQYVVVETAEHLTGTNTIQI